MLTAPVETTIDLLPFRRSFPALWHEVEGKLGCFLDNPAGTQVPQDVIDGFREYFITSNANLGGAFRTSNASMAIFAEAHQAMADFLGAASPHEIVFGQNMTTLTFALSRAIGRTLAPGDEIVLTTLDHDANVSPWRALSERGVVIRTADIHEEDCTLDMESLAAQITPRTKVVAVTHCSNLVGSIVDVHEVTRLAHAVGAISYIDAVQYAAHGPIDVQAIGCDFLVCSSYKFFGPHLGILYGKYDLLTRLQPYKVRPADPMPPGAYETGTLNFEGCGGLLGAFSYLERLGRAAFAARPEGGAVTANSDPIAPTRRNLLRQAFTVMGRQESLLGQRLISGLQASPGVKIWGITDPAKLHQRVPTVSFTLAGHSPESIAAYLGAQDIYVWSGNNYALPLTERLGLEDHGGVVRVGPVHYNTIADIDRFLSALEALSG